jgi:hypothetical protein
VINQTRLDEIRARSAILPPDFDPTAFAAEVDYTYYAGRFNPEAQEDVTYLLKVVTSQVDELAALREKVARVTAICRDSLMNDPSWWDGPNKRVVEILTALSEYQEGT